MSTSKRFGRLSHPIMKGTPYGGMERRRLQKKAARQADDEERARLAALWKAKRAKKNPGG